MPASRYLPALSSSLYVALCFASFACPALAETVTFQAKVIGVCDGDTITILHDRSPEKLRLASIDCPEKKQPFGKQARQFTSDQVFGQPVTIEATGHDRYRRTIATVRTADGRVLNDELVKAGLAWWFRQYAPDDTHLAALEQQARDQHLGLWSAPNPIAPWDWRKGIREPEAAPPDPAVPARRSQPALFCPTLTRVNRYQSAPG
jgi:micrococcal nuclease